MTDKINYHDRFFALQSNSGNGEVGAGTVFHYRQKGDVVWGTYEGGQILFGTLVAKIDENGVLDMRYQHVNLSGELMTGRCRSTPEVLPDNRLRLHESWQWTSGDNSAGTSVIVEIKR
ncbi:MAG TPA: hypothetical protein VM866_09955 [Pyrinomonadaceae bacterium]|jgi:hypothetical protein|nr:hypothetical protein [Pyrinomonadaceae bacterium]